MLYGGSLIIFGIMFFTALDITLRRLTGFSFEGLFEGIELMLVAAVYLGVANVQNLRTNVRVEMFVKRLSLKSQQALDAITLLLSLIVFSVAVWMTGSQAWKSYLVKEVTFMPAEHPVWLARIILTIGLTFLSLRLLIQIVEQVRNLCSQTEKSDRGEPT
jgi:TRAP-type mannitol/chloroaromatic compound transport system permease small subunit